MALVQLATVIMTVIITTYLVNFTHFTVGGSKMAKKTNATTTYSFFNNCPKLSGVKGSDPLSKTLHKTVHLLFTAEFDPERGGFVINTTRLTAET